MPGTVKLVDVSDHRQYTARAGIDGFYSMLVKPGRYTAYGWSGTDSVMDGNYTCSSLGRSTVQRLTQIDVICGEN